MQPVHSLQKQLDPAEVAARRSLVGSRYDLVDRNNNIVLEYRKERAGAADADRSVERQAG
ncbi:inverse autotransporter beta domain-containing protein [Escherichia coli]|nr:inverse autotransporter beta domain-containing protein [Escherichia coli]